MSRRLCRAVIFAIAGATAALAARAAFSESPVWHEQVLAGTLPALEQRLPFAPLVVTPVEKPGEYGGTWRMVLIGYNNWGVLSRSLAYEQLVRWDPNWTRVLPSVASSWTVNADATVYRFQLRRGMRWSDGEPFTAHDVVAWVDDVARDRELTPSPPPWLAVEGRLPECTAPDDATVEFRFATPHALFLEQLASLRANPLTHYPAHYFRRFHRRHDPAGAEELMRRTGLPWAEAFNTAYTPWTWRNAGVPTIDAWVLRNAYVEGRPTVEAGRNPYYWKVDTLGRQLPYLDAVKFSVVADGPAAGKWAAAGQVDYQRENLNDVAFIPTFQEAEKAGRIRTIRVVPNVPNAIAICLNLTHRDPGMRAALGDRRVRVALSEAINRPQLIQQLYGGDGQPSQIAPRPESPFFNRRLAEQSTEFDPGHARRLLEDAGLHLPFPGGLRSLPDGRAFQIQLLVPGPARPNWPRILDQVKQDWRSVGVAMEWSIREREDFQNRLDQNLHDGAVGWGGTGFAVMLEPEYFVPATFERRGAARVPYAVPWARWFLDPAAPGAEQPPEAVAQQLAVFRQVLAEPDPRARAALMARVLEMAADGFYALGICLEPSSLAVRTPGLRNVPASQFSSSLYPDPGPFNPCQFFQENSVIESR